MIRAFLFFLLFTFQVKSNFYDKYQAVRLYYSNDYDGAVQKFEKILLKDHQSLDNLVNMASALYKQGKFADAANYFNKVLSYKEKISKKQLEDITFNLGSAFASEEKWKLALQAFEDVLKINFKNERAKKNIEIIKKILEQQNKKQQQKQDQKNNEKDDKSGESKDQSKASNRDQNKENSKKQKDEQKGKQDRAQGQNKSAKQDSKSKGGNKSDGANQGEKNNASKQGLSNNQHKKDSSSSATSTNKKDKSVSAKKQASQPEGGGNAEEKLDWQQLKYLKAVEDVDQKANAQMLKVRAKKLQGKGGNANNW